MNVKNAHKIVQFTPDPSDSKQHLKSTIIKRQNRKRNIQ